MSELKQVELGEIFGEYKVYDGNYLGKEVTPLRGSERSFTTLHSKQVLSLEALQDIAEFYLKTVLSQYKVNKDEAVFTHVDHKDFAEMGIEPVYCFVEEKKGSISYEFETHFYLKEK